MLPELRSVMESTFESGFEKFWNAWPSSPRKGARTVSYTHLRAHETG
jgi:hypothetical protein